MSYCTLSPCLIKTKSEDFCSDMKLMEVFNAAIDFISTYSNLKLIIHGESIFCNMHPYLPPLNDPSISSFYITNIFKKLHNVIATAEIVDDKNTIICDMDSSYVPVDEDEVFLMCESICRRSNIILFVGIDNFQCKDKFFINVSNGKHTINVVKDPLRDTSGILDKHIKIDFSTNVIFPNYNLCVGLCGDLPPNRDSSIYHTYGQIVADRNGFKKMRYNSRWYKANAPHYCRKDNKFAIVLDDVHGTFEVFDYTKREPEYLGEYKFDGTLIQSKTSNVNTHKFYG